MHTLPFSHTHSIPSLCMCKCVRICIYVITNMNIYVIQTMSLRLSTARTVTQRPHIYTHARTFAHTQSHTRAHTHTFSQYVGVYIYIYAYICVTNNSLATLHCLAPALQQHTIARLNAEWGDLKMKQNWLYKTHTHTENMSCSLICLYLWQIVYMHAWLKYANVYIYIVICTQTRVCVYTHIMQESWSTHANMKRWRLTLQISHTRLMRICHIPTPTHTHAHANTHTPKHTHYELFWH